jgi:hypothetical protein
MFAPLFVAEDLTFPMIVIVVFSVKGTAGSLAKIGLDNSVNLA